MKLYRSVNDICWFASDPAIGWVRFPAEVNGWLKRSYVVGVELRDMREVPLSRGFNTGIPGAPMSAKSSVVEIRSAYATSIAAQRASASNRYEQVARLTTAV